MESIPSQNQCTRFSLKGAWAPFPNPPSNLKPHPRAFSTRTPADACERPLPNCLARPTRLKVAFSISRSPQSSQLKIRHNPSISNTEVFVVNRAILSLIFLTSSFGCQDSVAPPRLPTTVAPVVQKVKSAIVPLPQTVDVDPVRVALGNRLFHDPILSRDHTVSCASCHVIAGGGDDGRPRSIGIGGA